MPAFSKIKSPAHAAFEIGIFFKGLDGVAEIIGAFLLFVVSPSAISHVLAMVTQHELSEDPHDFIASHLLRISERFSADSQIFRGDVSIGARGRQSTADVGGIQPTEARVLSVSESMFY